MGCCDCFAEFGFECFERRRHQVLRICTVLSLSGLGFAILGFLGGFSLGPTAFREDLAWVKYTGPAGRSLYGGVQHLCDESTHECFRLQDADCILLPKTDAHQHCKTCQDAAKDMVVPIVLCTITYFLYARNTWLRYTGQDSTKAKVMSCFSCFFAGVNFSTVLVAYWQGCVRDASSHIEASMGLGLALMGIGASMLKFICGLLHLGLPVEAFEGSIEEYGSDSDDDDNGKE